MATQDLFDEANDALLRALAVAANKVEKQSSAEAAIAASTSVRNLAEAYSAINYPRS